MAETIMTWVAAVVVVFIVYLPIAALYRFWDRRGLPFRKSEPFILLYAVVVATPVFIWIGNARSSPRSSVKAFTA